MQDLKSAWGKNGYMPQGLRLGDELEVKRC